VIRFFGWPLEALAFLHIWDQHRFGVLDLGA
jgi:hypothetical protein